MPEQAQTQDQCRREHAEAERRDAERGARARTEDDKDVVEEGSDESFPASDPPSYTPGHA